MEKNCKKIMRPVAVLRRLTDQQPAPARNRDDELPSNRSEMELSTASSLSHRRHEDFMAINSRAVDSQQPQISSNTDEQY
jgi:hypothetical protein